MIQSINYAALIKSASQYVSDVTAQEHYPYNVSYPEIEEGVASMKNGALGVIRSLIDRYEDQKVWQEEGHDKLVTKSKPRRIASKTTLSDKELDRYKMFDAMMPTSRYHELPTYKGNTRTFIENHYPPVSQAKYFGPINGRIGGTPAPPGADERMMKGVLEGAANFRDGAASALRGVKDKVVDRARNVVRTIYDIPGHIRSMRYR